VIEDRHRRAIQFYRGDTQVAVLGINHPAFVARQRKAITEGVRRCSSATSSPGSTSR
jgi:hypothetical protein